MTFKLLYLDIHAVPDSATEALQILQCCDGLAANDVDVELVTPPGMATVESILGGPAAARLHFHPLEKPALYRLLLRRSSRWFYRRCVALVRDTVADAVLVRNLKLAEILLRAGVQVPVFFETHEIFTRTFAEDHPSPTPRQRNKLQLLKDREAYVYRQAAGLIAKTQLLLDDIRADFGTMVPACVLPNGVDMRQAEAARQARPENPKVVALYLGSLYRWKGVETALKAIQAAPNVELRIAGGPASRIAELETDAKQLGVSDQVSFLGPIAPDHRFQVINEADICLLPLASGSLGMRYTSPLKLFEYMAMGKAVVVSDLPSIREIADSDTVCLVEPGNAQALGAALNALADDVDRRTALGAAALNSSRHSSWAARGNTLLTFLQTTTEFWTRPA